MKKISKVICIILCISLLSACGQKAETAPGETVTGQTQNQSEETGSDEKLGKSNADLTSEEDPLDTTRLDDYIADFTSIKDADPGFEIEVTSPSGYRQEDVLAGMKLSNFTNPTLTDPENDRLSSVSSI